MSPGLNSGEHRKYPNYNNLLDRSPAIQPGAVLQAPSMSIARRFMPVQFCKHLGRAHLRLTADENLQLAAPAAILPVSAQPGAAILHLKIKNLQCHHAQPGQKLSITNNNIVCESCDSYGHFARYCPHRKPNTVAAQNKRDAIWAEKNSVQASELQEINKLIKEAERLHAMADTASIDVSDCNK
jgi:hypothetical protein